MEYVEDTNKLPDAKNILYDDIFCVRPKILLIEDNPTLQAINATRLTSLGCIVEKAKTGLEALAMFKNNYEIIFLDISLPDISGVTVAKAIRTEEMVTGCQITTIVALTEPGEVVVEDCYEVGVDEFYTKSIQVEQLKWIFFKWLPRHCKYISGQIK